MTYPIRYTGAPRMTEGGRDVLAFHLHRYLSGWLERERRARVLVTVGFEHSQAESASFEASIARCEVVDVAWTFEDLCHIYRRGDGRLHVEQPGDAGTTAVYDLVPLLDMPADDSEPRVLLGFVLVDDADIMVPDSLHHLAAQATEAIRAARRNAMRLFFDEKKSLPIKTFLYQLLEHLPEWTGCDHSSAMLMTSSLEAMTLEASAEARFDFLAERLYHDDDQAAPRRLVGMSVCLDSASAGFLREAVERQARDPDQPFQVFWRSHDDPDAWSPAGDDTQLRGFHRCEERDDESMCVLVPMLAHEETESEQLGFVVLVFRRRGDLARSTGDLLAELGQNLTAMLRYSPLYTLNARKLWILGQTRAAIEQAVAGPHTDRVAQIEGLIGEVTSLIVPHVDVPSFAIAYLRLQDDADGTQRRHLRYAHPHGWTHFEQLTLPVDVGVDQRADSGVCSLAVRINRALVLAGGRGEGEQLAFKNYLHVHEDRGVVVDARSTQSGRIEDDGGWVRLSEYYKPARSSAYATLAFPIAFGGEPLGVVSVEVERDTNWLWWTGFGAQLFWELLANELAYAFHALGVGE